MDNPKKFLIKYPPFKNLNSDHLMFLFDCAQTVTLQEGDTLFRSGEEARKIYIVQEGKMAIEISSGEERVVTLQTLGKGEMIGWSWLIPPHYWRFDTKAIAPTELISLEGLRVRTKCKDDHEFGYTFMVGVAEILAQRLESTRIQLVDMYGLKKH